MGIFFFAAVAIAWIVAIGLALGTTIFWIVELVDIVRRQFRDPYMQIVWLLIVACTHFVGALVYYFIGKRDGVLPDTAPYPR